MALRCATEGDLRVFISIDLEGCSGICHSRQTVPGEASYVAARRLMRADLEAVLEGCRAAGVERAVVCDAHARGANLEWHDLPAWVTLVAGAPQPQGMMSGVDDGFDAALLVGYHAMAGTRAAVLDHTFTQKVFRIRVDDALESGELGLNAAVAGAFGVPVVFASGDDKLAVEAGEAIPGVRSAVVKHGVARSGARLLAPEIAAERLREGVREALEAGERPLPLVWDERPLRVVFTRSDYCDLAAACPGVERVDARSVRIDEPTHLQAYRCLVACLRLAATAIA